MSARICESYVGVACIDGSCPVANSEEYEERCIPVVKSCKDCHCYRGCEDCYFDGTEHCIKTHEKDSGKIKIHGENSMRERVFPISECPRCGGKMFTVRQKIFGTGEYYVDLETRDIDSSELHSGLQYKNIGKWVTCTDCGKRLFKVNYCLEVID